MRSGWWSGDWAVTQPWGCTDLDLEPANPHHPECPHFHDGIDIGLSCGQAVYCPLPATCVQLGVEGLGPYALILDLGAWWVWLGHLQAAFTAPGQAIPAGAQVGAVGDLGVSRGCHLHFQITPAGGGYFDSVEPSDWLADPLAALQSAVYPPWWLGLSWLPMAREGRAGLMRLCYWFLGRQPEMTPDGLGEHYQWADQLAPDLSNLDAVLIAFAADASREQAAFPLQPQPAAAGLTPATLRPVLLQLLGVA